MLVDYNMRPIYVLGLAVIGIAGISAYTRGGYYYATDPEVDTSRKVRQKRYGEITTTPQEDEEYSKLWPAAQKGDQKAKARINQLHNLETARSLKSIKATTGSYPIPAKIPDVLKKHYQHTMPNQIPDIVNKAHAGHPLTQDEETQLHSIEARGKVSSCGSGCICETDGHCSLGCPTAGYECDYSKDRHSWSPKVIQPVQKPGIFDSLAQGIGSAWNHLVHGQNIYGQPMGGGVIGATPQPASPTPMLQTPIPIAGYGFRYAGFYDLPA